MGIKLTVITLCSVTVYVYTSIRQCTIIVSINGVFLLHAQLRVNLLRHCESVGNFFFSKDAHIFTGVLISSVNPSSSPQPVVLLAESAKACLS